MNAYLIAFLLGLVFYLIERWNCPAKMSPDGRFYGQITLGNPVPRPYCWRWGLPALLGNRGWTWKWWNALVMISMPVLLAAYLNALGFVPWQQIAGVVFLLGLHGLWRLNILLPVLVDPTAFCLSLAAATAALDGHLIVAALLALGAGAVKETAPVFAAVFSMNPICLVGLLGVKWWAEAGESPDWAKEWLDAPLAAARATHAGLLLQPQVSILPWGALALLLPFAAWPWNALCLPAALALALGYGQLLAAQDRARLFCWAAPPVIALALTALPDAPYLIPLLAAHVLNPYRGT